MSNNQVRVGILGATGMVGQRFVQMLEHHPGFEVTALAASDRSQGKPYAEACTWRLVGDMPAFAKAMVVQPPLPPLDCDVVVSSLPSDVARASEEAFARAGYPVISNASCFRMDEDVPLLIPEINSKHLDVIDAAKKRARVHQRLHRYESKLLHDHHGSGARSAAREIRHRGRDRDNAAGGFRSRISRSAVARRGRQRTALHQWRRTENGKRDTKDSWQPRPQFI